LHDGLWNAVAERQPGMFRKVPRLAMNRHDNPGSHPFVHFDELGPARVSGHMDMRLAFSDDPNRKIG
jgi:hypothetical protein